MDLARRPYALRETLRKLLGSSAEVHNRVMRMARVRENVFEVRATDQELSALVAGARLALDVMRSAPEPPAEAIAMLERVLADFDGARQRLLRDEPDDGQP
jgi:hypothetical protein